MSETNINSSKNELIENTNNNLNMINIRNNSENVINNDSNENVNIINENKSKIIFFYSQYKYLCYKHGVENIRKNRIDIIMKKVKIKIFKAIHEILKFCLNIHHINRLPQNFIINIRIEFNKKYLEKTVEEIYLEFSILPSLEEMKEKNYINKDKIDIFTIFIKSKLKDIIKIYLLSELFILDKKNLEKKSGINDAILFDFVANNICNYFLYGNSSNIETIITEKDSIINNNVFKSGSENK
jgi:hypothetical protein